jgi:topoisomerase IA-like protein
MNALKTFKIKNKTYNLRKGPYGYYLQIFTTGKKKPENISLSAKINPDKVTKESVIKILNKMKEK